MKADGACLSQLRMREFVLLKNFTQARIGIVAARLYQGRIYLLLKREQGTDASSKTPVYTEITGQAEPDKPYIDDIMAIVSKECYGEIALKQEELTNRLGLVNHMRSGVNQLHVIFWPPATSIPSSRALSEKWCSLHGDASRPTEETLKPYYWVLWDELKTVNDQGDVTVSLLDKSKVPMRLPMAFVKDFVRNSEVDMALQCFRKKFANK